MEVTVEQYFLLSALIGLVQCAALQKNEHLIAEDFGHMSGTGCLFSIVATEFEVKRNLVHPRICSGCRRFYEQLGVLDELSKIKRFMDEEFAWDWAQSPLWSTRLGHAMLN